MKVEEINELFVCQCGSHEHQLIFRYFTEDEDQEVYVTVHLSPGNWWERLKNGIRYIFGYRSKYGEFDEFIFRREDAERLQGVVNYLKKGR